MNKIYSVVWSEVRQSWVVAREFTKRQSKSSTTRQSVSSSLFAGLLAASMQLHADPASNALPTGGNVVAGQANINQSGNALNINQTTGKAAINWNTFSIGSNASVNIVQPGSSSVLLNRVIGSDPSQIYGRMTANGQVFLINPNGILFGRGARVDVGGLIASTLNIGDADFMAGNYRFTGNSYGSVVNQGDLYGQYIALLAPEVRNENLIVAQQGTVALAGGKNITLNLVNNQLIDVMVDAADVNTLVENRHLIQAQEGTVILAANSANHLLGKVVNSGSIEANGISKDGGKVRLTASSNIEHSGNINVDAGTNGNGGSAIVIASLDNAASQTSVSGIISARGGNQSGNGGFIETSGTNLKIFDSAKIITSATKGYTGQWLIDPDDFVIGTDITGVTLGGLLNANNVTIQTTATTSSCNDGSACGTGANGSNLGDIIINDSVTWSSANSLTLNAYNDIIFNNSLSAVDPLFGAPTGATIQITYGGDGAGKAVIKSGVTWDPFAPIIFDNVAGHSFAATAFGVVDTSRDFWIGTKGQNVFVRLLPGSGVYGDTNLPYGFYDAAGGTRINIQAPTGTPTWSTANSAMHVAGVPYSLTYTGGLTATSHYEGLAAGNAANWTTTARPITLAANNQTKTYGDVLALSIAAFTLTSGSLVFGNTITSATIASANGYAGAAGQGANTYTNEITIASAAGGGGFTATDYNITYDAGDLTINPATLTYTANTANMAAGSAVPALSGTVTGFVLGEDLTATTGSLAFTTPATSGSGAGSYAINGGGLTAANYTFVQAAGNASALTITGSGGSGGGSGGGAGGGGGGVNNDTPLNAVDIIKRTLGSYFVVGKKVFTNTDGTTTEREVIVSQANNFNSDKLKEFIKNTNTNNGINQDDTESLGIVKGLVQKYCNGNCTVTDADILAYMGAPKPNISNTLKDALDGLQTQSKDLRKTAEDRQKEVENAEKALFEAAKNASGAQGSDTDTRRKAEEDYNKAVKKAQDARFDEQKARQDADAAEELVQDIQDVVEKKTDSGKLGVQNIAEIINRSLKDQNKDDTVTDEQIEEWLGIRKIEDKSTAINLDDGTNNKPVTGKQGTKDTTPTQTTGTKPQPQASSTAMSQSPVRPPIIPKAGSRSVALPQSQVSTNPTPSVNPLTVPSPSSGVQPVIAPSEPGVSVMGSSGGGITVPSPSSGEPVIGSSLNGVSGPSTIQSEGFVTTGAPGTGLQSVPDIGGFAVTAGRPVTIQIPSGTFTHSEANAEVAVEARQANGQPLPAWLKFDPTKGEFSGTPPIGLTQQISIEVFGSDKKGNRVSTHLYIDVRGSGKSRPPDGSGIV